MINSLPLTPVLPLRIRYSKANGSSLPAMPHHLPALVAAVGGSKAGGSPQLRAAEPDCPACCQHGFF